MGVTLVKDLEPFWPRVSAHLLCGTGLTHPPTSRSWCESPALPSTWLAALGRGSCHPIIIVIKMGHE